MLNHMPTKNPRRTTPPPLRQHRGGVWKITWDCYFKDHRWSERKGQRALTPTAGSRLARGSFWGHAREGDPAGPPDRTRSYQPAEVWSASHQATPRSILGYPQIITSSERHPWTGSPPKQVTVKVEPKWGRARSDGCCAAGHVLRVRNWRRGRPRPPCGTRRRCPTACRLYPTLQPERAGCVLATSHAAPRGQATLTAPSVHGWDPSERTDLHKVRQHLSFPLDVPDRAGDELVAAELPFEQELVPRGGGHLAGGADARRSAQRSSGRASHIGVYV